MESEAWIEPLHAYGLNLARKFTLHDPAMEPEDILQDTWASAYPRLAAIADDTDRKRLIAVCIRNHATHIYRRRKRRFETSMQQKLKHHNHGGAEGDITLEWLLPARGDIEADTMTTLALRDLVAAAEAGDGIVACALLVAAFGQDVAMARLGIPPGTAGSRVARFRNRYSRKESRSGAEQDHKEVA